MATPDRPSEPAHGPDANRGSDTAPAPRVARVPDRMRVPAPLLRYRMASGRGAMEQPNVTGDGDAALDPRFWAAVVAVGVLAGLGGDLMMLVLFSAQHLAFDYHHGSLEQGIEATSATRRVVVLLLAGAFGGPAWFLLRRWTPGQRAEVDDVLWRGDARLSAPRSLATATISEVVVGMGASIGREASPKLLGGLSGSLVAGWLSLTDPQRRLLVACGAGAGLAAVYDVPLAGALFTAEILIGAVALPTVLPALACSGIATAVAWIYLPNHATYVDVPSYPFHLTLLIWALPGGLVLGVVAAGFNRLIGWVSHHRPQGLPSIAAPLVAFGIVGVVGIRYPQLFGNGKDMAHDVFLGGGTLLLLLALSALKPLLTALCIGSGASGGLLTPVLSTGAVLGGFLGLAWTHLWPGASVGAFALIGAAALVGAALQAPMTGLLLVLELTQTDFQIVVPMLIATVGATAVARWIDGYSIYSARLPAE